MFVEEEMKEEWDEESDQLNMSRSEFIRSMVHAGRKQISQLNPKPEQESSNVREQVLAAIPKDEAKPVDEIVNEVVNPIEKDIQENILPHLDENNEIRFDPQEKGYKKQ